jgi:hypothetical protein
MDAHLAPIVAAPPKRNHNAKKRMLEILGPSPYDKDAFWSAVETDDAESVFLFLTRHTAVVDVWRKNEAALMPTLKARTLSGNKGYQASASLGVFYRCGFSMPDDAWYLLLNHWLGPLQADAKFRVHFLPILERFEKDVKHQPWLLEVMLVAAAEQQNSAVFQNFFPRGARRCLFDVQPGRLVNMPTVLQAVIHWQDAKLRRDFVSDVLSRCSAAYVVMPSRTQSSGDASNALESAAAITIDPDIVRLLTQRLKADNCSDVCADLAASALKLSLARLSSGACTLTTQVAETHAMLLDCLDERRLGTFHEHFADLRHSIIFLRSSTRSHHAPQYPGVLDMLSKCEGVLRVVAESVMQKQSLTSITTVCKYGIEQDAFQDRLESHVLAAKNTQALAEDNEVLKSRLRTMQSVLQKQAHLVLAVKRQARQINALKDAKEPEMTELLDSPFVLEMESRLLKLQLPDVPSSALSSDEEFYGFLSALDTLATRIPTSPKDSRSVSLALTNDGKM